MFSYVRIVRSVSLRNIIDMLLVSFLFYYFYNFLKRTKGVQVIKGVFLVLAAMKVSEVLGFVTLYWIIKNTLTVGVISLIIIFQPELRKALEHLGRGRIIRGRELVSNDVVAFICGEISDTASALSQTKTGMLIVVERNSDLSDYISRGVKIDAVISSSLLQNIFIENTPLHDGAVIVRGERIMSASSVLPLTEQNIKKGIGTRHRAALGISESTDALAVVVSEETGVISMAIDGKLHRNYTKESLYDVMYKILAPSSQSSPTKMIERVKVWFPFRRKK